MKILIVEDEIPAANQLKRLILKQQPEAEIIEVIDSVKGAIKWFSSHENPDLVFMDIQLGDGLSFEIFDYCQIKTPIIFTTAYDQYAIRAFKVNSIDYLLKPFDDDDLKSAMDKFNQLQTGHTNVDGSALDEVLKILKQPYKTRFIIKVGEHLHAIDIKDIIYFFSLEKATYLITSDNQRFILDYSLEQLSEMLDPSLFFRINRKYIIRFEAISDMVSYVNSRIKIKLRHAPQEEVIVSRDKVNDFKIWLDR